MLRVQLRIAFLAFLGRKLPDPSTQQVRLVRPRSPQDIALHATWDQSPPVPMVIEVTGSDIAPWSKLGQMRFKGAV